MDKIKFKNESLPKRCEICHKDDLFDHLNNKCSRCNNLNNYEFISIDLIISNNNLTNQNNKSNIYFDTTKSLLVPLSNCILDGVSGGLLGGLISSSLIIFITDVYGIIVEKQYFEIVNFCTGLLGGIILLSIMAAFNGFVTGIIIGLFDIKDGQRFGGLFGALIATLIFVFASSSYYNSSIYSIIMDIVILFSFFMTTNLFAGNKTMRNFS
jgi:hypothetical protein